MDILQDSAGDRAEVDSFFKKFPKEDNVQIPHSLFVK